MSSACLHEWGTQWESAFGPSNAVCLKCGYKPSSAPEENYEAKLNLMRNVGKNMVVLFSRASHRAQQQRRVRRELAEFKRRERQNARLRGAP